MDAVLPVTQPLLSQASQTQSGGTFSEAPSPSATIEKVQMLCYDQLNAFEQAKVGVPKYDLGKEALIGSASRPASVDRVVERTLSNGQLILRRQLKQKTIGLMRREYAQHLCTLLNKRGATFYKQVTDYIDSLAPEHRQYGYQQIIRMLQGNWRTDEALLFLDHIEDRLSRLVFLHEIYQTQNAAPYSRREITFDQWQRFDKEAKELFETYLARIEAGKEQDYREIDTLISCVLSLGRETLLSDFVESSKQYQVIYANLLESFRKVFVKEKRVSALEEVDKLINEAHLLWIEELIARKTSYFPFVSRLKRMVEHATERLENPQILGEHCKALFEKAASYGVIDESVALLFNHCLAKNEEEFLELADSLVDYFQNSQSYIAAVRARRESEPYAPTCIIS